MIFTKAINTVKNLIKKTRLNAVILYLCFKDNKTPLSAKIISLIALALAFSPIDLIPDFIPVIGYLDDIIIIPLLIFIAFKLIPEDIISGHKHTAETLNLKEYPVFRKTGIVIAFLWITALTVIIFHIITSMNLCSGKFLNW